jgi:nucleotide-binding universal stress UspA family protein
LYGARVTVVSVAPLVRVYDGPMSVGGYGPGMVEECECVERQMREHAESTASRMRSQGIDADAVTTRGSAAHEIAEIARTHKADLHIIGAKGGGPVSRVLLGSVAEAVSGRVDASLLIARTAPKANRILSATDGGSESARAVATALAYASETGADLIVMGARGLGRVRGALFGSVSHRVAYSAGSSVLLVRRPSGE